MSKTKRIATSNGKIKIGGDPILALQVQQMLFKKGYSYPKTGKTIKTGSRIYGLYFGSFTSYTSVNKKPVKRTHRILRWTSNPAVYRNYSVREVAPDGFVVYDPPKSFVDNHATQLQKTI